VSSFYRVERGSEKSLIGPQPFVAAFANANCGDVSGNVELGRIPDGIGDRARMQKHGRRQFEAASSPV
jgi:neutral ceramidase